VAHRYAIAYGYRVDLEWLAARACDALFNGLDYGPEVDVSWDYLGVAIDDGYEGLLEVSVA